MILPIVSIPPSIANGLAVYEDLFPRSETFQHIKEYCTGLVVLERPSIRRMAHCFVDGPCQSSLNKAITASPWEVKEINQRRFSEIASRHYTGQTVGIVDSTFIHHPRGQTIYGVYKYWDYVEHRYTYAIQLVTAAIATHDRLDGFDYRIYHRSFEQQERLYLEHTALPDDCQDLAAWRRRSLDLFSFERNRRQAKTKSQLAVELIDAMEAIPVAPNVYAIDSGLFTPDVIARIEFYQKPWVADSEKNRILYYKGQRYNCETFQQTLRPSLFKAITVSVRQHERTVWVFTCCVRIRRYGKVRLAIIYDNPNKQGEPIYVFSKMLVWNAYKIASVRLHRWDIEPFHEQIKHFLGAEDSQLQTEDGVRKHLTLVFVVNSLLQSLDLSSPIGDLSMERSENMQSMPTFGQRCRRIVLEVFYDLITTIHQWITEKTKTVSEIFETLFRRFLYA